MSCTSNGFSTSLLSGAPWPLKGWETFLHWNNQQKKFIACSVLYEDFHATSVRIQICQNAISVPIKITIYLQRKHIQLLSKLSFKWISPLKQQFSMWSKKKLFSTKNLTSIRMIRWTFLWNFNPCVTNGHTMKILKLN